MKTDKKYTFKTGDRVRFTMGDCNAGDFGGIEVLGNINIEYYEGKLATVIDMEMDGRSADETERDPASEYYNIQFDEHGLKLSGISALSLTKSSAKKKITKQYVHLFTTGEKILHSIINIIDLDSMSYIAPDREKIREFVKTSKSGDFIALATGEYIFCHSN